MQDSFADTGTVRRYMLVLGCYNDKQFKKENLTLVATFDDPRDAEDAVYKLNHVRYHGRELEVEFARGDRKSEYIVLVSQ